MITNLFSFTTFLEISRCIIEAAVLESARVQIEKLESLRVEEKNLVEQERTLHEQKATKLKAPFLAAAVAFDDALQHSKNRQRTYDSSHCEVRERIQETEMFSSEYDGVCNNLTDLHQRLERRHKQVSIQLQKQQNDSSIRHYFSRHQGDAETRRELEQVQQLRQQSQRHQSSVNTSQNRVNAISREMPSLEANSANANDNCLNSLKEVQRLMDAYDFNARVIVESNQMRALPQSNILAAGPKTTSTTSTTKNTSTTGSSPIVPIPNQFKYHGFLTHNWSEDENGRNNHERVSRIHQGLKAKGLNMWFDSERMQGAIVDQMIQGIDDSAIVVVFLTKKYMNKM